MVSIMGQQALIMEEKYAPLVGINQYGEGEATDELQFWNYGHWVDGETDPKRASLRLLHDLINELPTGQNKILDVAFGQGRSLIELSRIYGSENVTGINIATDQVQHAKAAGINCEILQMDAAKMTFEDQNFDGILCMEAAFHFKSRKNFLAHAFRTLKPGGKLVLSDFLMRGIVGLNPMVFPPENCVASVDEYRDLFLGAGFKDENLDIRLSTNDQLVPFFVKQLTYAGYLPDPDPKKINMDAAHSQVAITFILTRLLNISETVLVTATR